jgi:HPr kinase/phosphorylase
LRSALSTATLLRDADHHLALKMVVGERGVNRSITAPRVQKLGLAMSGYLDHVRSGRIQILGETEISFLSTMPAGERDRILRSLCERDVACLVVTKGLPVPEELVRHGEAAGTPVLSSALPTAEFIARVTRFMEDWTAPAVSLHGVLVDVSGVGLLLLGKSGIGKSELALDLVARGHRLCADDVVDIQRQGSELEGAATDILGHHMEVRGLGIINIPDLFGVGAVRDRKRIDLCVELDEWDPRADYDRLGLDDKTYEILGVAVPYIKIPVRPGRNLTTLVEVAARNQLLKVRGHHSAREFQQSVDAVTAASAPVLPRESGPVTPLPFTTEVEGLDDPSGPGDDDGNVEHAGRVAVVGLDGGTGGSIGSGAELGGAARRRGR